jgi:uncharacterized membrane protein
MLDYLVVYADLSVVKVRKTSLRSRLRVWLTEPLRIRNPRWLVPILALAALLRFFRIGYSSLWFDEAFSWLVARQPAWAILTQRLVPILPPFYHFLLHFWIRLGECEAVLRSLSAFCSLLTIPVIYTLGRDIFDSATGLASAFLMTILPFQIYFAQEARPYGLIIFLSALLLWHFQKSWDGGAYWLWCSLGGLAALNLYAHHFAAFLLLVFHLRLLLEPRGAHRWRGLLLADLVALALVGPHLPSAWAQTRQVTANFWLPTPSPLTPFKTLDYLLFGHTTPMWLVPFALFVTLAIVALVILAVIQARRGVRRRGVFLLALVFVPLTIPLVLSWLIGPVYLSRSLSLVTPAYVLLLGWGLAHPPRRSPLRLLYVGLAIVIVVSLGNHYLTSDPAKPPFHEIGAVVDKHWQDGDVMFHLHDSSYLPLRYYAPGAESYLLNNDPKAWLPPYTWAWAGRRTSSLDKVIEGRDRLWVVVTQRRLDERQSQMLDRIAARYAEVRTWSWGSLTLVLYDR